jgi:patatin-like phospholipase/acyl hydrolase
MEALLSAMFGEATLGQLKKRVVIPSFQMSGLTPQGVSWKPKIFHNFPYPGEPDLAQRIVDVGLRTSAAPVLLPVYQGFVDGGLFANNPSLCALTQILSDRRREHGAEAASARPLQELDIALFSVGTGSNGQAVKVGTEDWGYRKWLFDSQYPLLLLDTFLSSDPVTIDFQCQQILGPAYWRLNPPLSSPIVTSALAFGNRNAIDILNRAAFEANLGPTLEWIDRSGWFDDEETADNIDDVTDVTVSKAPADRRRRPGSQKPGRRPRKET